MDKFADMVLFASIVKNQGLAAAGRELSLSPATVTARLQALEDRYGVKLLNRSTRHLSLTESGVLYHQACLEILTAFIEQYPEVVPYLYLNDNISNLAESGLDVVIRYGELADSSLISRKLATSRRVLCASPAYLARKGIPKTPQDLAQHDCLAMVRSNEEMKTWHFQENEQHKVITVVPKSFADDGEVIRQWALAGMGIALKSILDVQDDLNQQRLVTVLDGYMKNFNASTSASGADLNVLYLSRQYQPKRLRLFIDFLIEQCALRLAGKEHSENA
ncbi:LysR family transcriptional regulator [Vibrio cholerae]